MKRFKFRTSALDIIGVVLILGIIIALALPSYSDYSPRASIGAALVFLGNGRAALESSCSDGTFASKQRGTDIGLPESDFKAYVSYAELVRVRPGVARIKVVLTEIYGRPFFGLFPWEVIPQGSILEYELICSAEKLLSSRFSSTVEPKYLPATLRGQ